MRLRKTLLVGFAGLGVLPAIAAAQTTFSITGIAPLAGDNFSAAFGINNNGEVIGISYDATIQVATSTTKGSLSILGGSGFSYSGSTTTVIPALGTNAKGLDFTSPVAVNDSGEIIGASTQSGGGGALTGFIDVGGTVTNSDLIFSGIPLGLNDSGVIVGADSTLDTLVRYNGTAQVLNGLTADTTKVGLAFGINNSGVVAGSSSIAGSTTKSPLIDVVEWPANSATPTDLGGVAGLPVNIAFAINNGGDAVGYGFNPVDDTSTTKINVDDQNGSIVLGLPYPVITTGEGSEFFSGEALLYSAKSNKIIGLGDLGGGFSMAEAINDSGDVVGMSLDSSGDYHAFLYNGTAMVDLNSLLPAGSGWDLINADGINSAGDIVGYGDDDGLLEGFVLTPNGTISGTGGNGGNGNSGGSGGSSSGGSTGAVAVPLPVAVWPGLMGLAGLGMVAMLRKKVVGGNAE
jgi:probable HAF family extracellular repeat protein